jgi:hypothetical protein
VVQDEGNDRRNREGTSDADGHHQERDEQGRRIAWQEAEARQPRGHQQLARDDRDYAPESLREPGHEGIQEGNKPGHGQEQKPGLQGAGSAFLLEVEALEEDDAVERRHGDPGDNQGRGDCA